jgi:hypothetical protein
MRAFVDQINGDQASLLLGDNEQVKVTVPVGWLPADVREGQVLKLTFVHDPEATAESKARVQALYDKLGNEP